MKNLLNFYKTISASKVAKLRHKGFSIVEIAVSITVMGLLTTGTFSGFGYLKKQQVNNLVTQIAKIKNSTRLFYAINNYMPGDMLDASMADYKGGARFNLTECGNGDGVISWNSRQLSITCSDATCSNVPICSGTGGSVSSGVLTFSSGYNESALFARQLWLFGGLDDFGFASSYNNQSLNENNTIPTKFKNTIILPIYIASTDTSGIDASIGFKNQYSSGKTHTFLITGLSNFSQNTLHQKFDSLSPLALNTQFKLPADFVISKEIASKIDYKIDDGLRSSGDIKHCASLTSCQDSNNGDVVIGVKFDL